jgi:hypothetical protein
MSHGVTARWRDEDAGREPAQGFPTHSSCRTLEASSMAASAAIPPLKTEAVTVTPRASARRSTAKTWPGCE